MKFEKLNENKIRITMSMQDLEEKDIDFHAFMSNSLETQDLFLDMLAEAEEKIGFRTRNCRVKIEALAMTENDFIVTVTRFPVNTLKKQAYASPKKKLKVKRKANTIQSDYLIYRFPNFDDYCVFIEYLVTNQFMDSYKIAKKLSVYTYQNAYFLILEDINANYPKAKSFFSIISEFATYVLNPELFVHKLFEVGTPFMKNNAFKKSFTHFITK